jgi:hypothetical protein
VGGKGSFSFSLMYVQQKAIRRLLFILRALANNLAGAFLLQTDFCR